MHSGIHESRFFLGKFQASRSSFSPYHASRINPLPPSTRNIILEVSKSAGSTSLIPKRHWLQPVMHLSNVRKLANFKVSNSLQLRSKWMGAFGMSSSTSSATIEERESVARKLLLLSSDIPAAQRGLFTIYIYIYLYIYRSIPEGWFRRSIIWESGTTRELLFKLNLHLTNSDQLQMCLLHRKKIR